MRLSLKREGKGGWRERREKKKRNLKKKKNNTGTTALDLKKVSCYHCSLGGVYYLTVMELALYTYKPSTQTSNCFHHRPFLNAMNCDSRLQALSPVQGILRVLSTNLFMSQEKNCNLTEP